MSEPELPTDRNLVNRIVSTVFLLLIAIPFATEGARRILDGDHLYSGIAFAVAFISVTPVFLLWIGKDQILQKFQLLRVTADARWWVSLAFVLLIYFGWSNMQTGHEVKPKQGANYLAIGPDPWEGSPLAIAWRAAQLREPAPNPPWIKYYRFIVNARNISEEPIKLKDGYIVSSTDASRLPLLVSVANEQPFSIDDANPVPPHAEMFLTANFPEGTSEPTLLREWGSFSAVVEYDNKQERRQFERGWVVQQLAGNDPAAQPHVSKKK
jgi:hypothetical protein